MIQVQVLSQDVPAPVSGAASQPVAPEAFEAPAGIGADAKDRIENALSMLFEAAALAQDVSKEIWEFSVEIGTLLDLGLTNNDFRWMVASGLAAHSRETTDSDSTHRVFVSSNNLSFTERTCFVITPRGTAHVTAAQEVSAARESRNQRHPRRTLSVDQSAGKNGEPRVATPTWDADRQQLRLGQVIVKQFKVPAVNQETILAAFQEEGWGPRIDDPLKPKMDQDIKRRLHDTINSLNRNQKTPLIRFMGDGKGEGIRWEFTRDLAAAVDLGEEPGDDGSPIDGWSSNLF